MTTQERTVVPDLPPSPYLSLRQAVRPAIFAHFLLAETTNGPGVWPRSARICSS